MEHRGILAALLLTAFLISTCHATDRTVCASGCNYQTIQAAINGVSAGDRIIVGEGTYKESVVVNKSVSLLGQGCESTVIEAQNTTNDNVVTIRAENVTLTGFTLNRTQYGAGVYLMNARNCSVSLNTITSTFHGIIIQNSTNNTVADNNLSWPLYGFYMVMGASDNTIRGNNITSTSYGIYIYGSPSSTGNRFYDNYIKSSIHAESQEQNIWNATKTAGTNIMGGPYIGGNYWSNYTGTDGDGDGIGDTPYVIDDINVDYLPLVSPTTSTSTSTSSTSTTSTSSSTSSTTPGTTTSTTSSTIPSSTTSTSSTIPGSTTSTTSSSSTTSTTPSGYCTSESNSCEFEHIARVRLNTGDSVSGASNYTDYTGSVFTSLQAGASYTLYVDVYADGEYEEYVKAWIDWDLDNDLTGAGEEIVVGNYSFEGTHTFSKTFTVPATASSGNTVMRLSLRYHDYSTGPCEIVDFGEVEDYTVRLSGGASTTSTTTTVPVSTTVPPCTLPGDYPTCGTVTLAEVVAYINEWSEGTATLGAVIDLINAWAA